jgi:hypothetical protein
MYCELTQHRENIVDKPELPTNVEKRDYNGPSCPMLSHYFPEAFENYTTGYVPPAHYKPDSHNKEIIDIEDDFFAIQLMNVSHLGAKYSLAPYTVSLLFLVTYIFS